MNYPVCSVVVVKTGAHHASPLTQSDRTSTEGSHIYPKPSVSAV